MSSTTRIDRWRTLEELTIPVTGRDESTEETPPDPESPASADPGDTDIPTTGYSSFQLAEPEANQTVRSDTGEVKIAIFLEPALEEGHEIQLVVDGRPLEGKFTSTQLLLSDLGRGSHTLQAKIVDGEGETVASTQVLNFHVRKAPLDEGNSESRIPE